MLPVPGSTVVVCVLDEGHLGVQAFGPETCSCSGITELELEGIQSSSSTSFQEFLDASGHVLDSDSGGSGSLT